MGLGLGNPFVDQVYFHRLGTLPSRKHRWKNGLNPFENQVYFHSGPGKALCGAALRRYFREPPAVFRNQMLLMIDVFEFMMNEENGWKS